MSRPAVDKVEDGEAHYDDSTSAESVSRNTSSSSQKSSRFISHSHRVSTLDGMSSIPESEEANFQNSVDIADGQTTLLDERDHIDDIEQPSLLRRFTKRLKSVKVPSSLPSASLPGVTASIPLNPMRSLRRRPEQSYENLENIDDDHESVPVDLSLISGLGFEITEMNATSTGAWLDQDTSYQSLHMESTKPAFQSFVRKRQLGEGLVVGAQVKRDPTIRRANTPDEQIEELKRTNTVKAVAQKVAKSSNMIVAVTESVDLSFLEGHAPRRQTHQTFDNMINRTGTIEEPPQSYFFPPDPNIPSWRPMTMSTPYILFLTTGAFALAGCQEYLCQKSQWRQAEQRGLIYFDDVSVVSVGVFFVWKYLPTMVTIIYAVLFSVMDFDIRRLEPFYQLSQSKGSPASESLNVDHLTMFQYFVPFKALRMKQWTVFLSTMANIIASTASPALQNPSVDFGPNPACKTSDDGNSIICPDGAKKYVVLISPVWSRLLTASYVLIGIIAFLIYLQLRRKTGLLSDPKGIAGIASMATKSHILREFKDTDLMNREDIQKRLEHRRFVLYKSSIWQGQWSLENAPQQESSSKLASPHPPMLRLAAGAIFVLVQVLCLTAVPLISLTKLNVIPNEAPWLPILVATVLKLIWSTFEADVRLMEPFYRLSLGNAPPEKSLTLDYQSTVYGFLPFKAAFNGHWLLCAVGICSVLLDILSVTVSSFSVQADIFYDSKDDGHQRSNGDETMVSFWVSVVLSMAILLFVIIITSLVYIRRRHPFLPREPSTIASVLAFIYASNMLEDFIGTEELTNKEMERRLKGLGKKYALAWFRGRDGEIHCAIDQEPHLSRYVHGKRYDQAMAGPVDTYYA